MYSYNNCMILMIVFLLGFYFCHISSNNIEKWTTGDLRENGELPGYLSETDKYNSDKIYGCQGTHPIEKYNE